LQGLASVEECILQGLKPGFQRVLNAKAKALAYLDAKAMIRIAKAKTLAYLDAKAGQGCEATASAEADPPLRCEMTRRKAV